MYESYDETYATWLCKDDIIEYNGEILLVNMVEDDGDQTIVVGIDKWDDEISVTIPCLFSVSLVYWQD